MCDHKTTTNAKQAEDGVLRRGHLAKINRSAVGDVLKSACQTVKEPTACKHVGL